METKNPITPTKLMVETTTPAAISGVGQVYTKSDDKLYFQDGSGSENDISSGCPVRTLHNNSDSPFALWQLDGGLLDTSGNSRDLSATGTPRYGAGFVDENSKAFFTLSAGNYGSRSDPNFDLRAALTYACLLRPEALQSRIYNIVAYDDFGGFESQNMLYNIYYQTGKLQYRHQHGAGITDNLDSEYPLVPWEWQHVAFTRSADGKTVKLFVNGAKVGSTTFGNAPTGGTDSDLRVGAHDSIYPYYGSIASVIMWTEEKSEAYMLALSNARFGL